MSWRRYERRVECGRDPGPYDASSSSSDGNSIDAKNESTTQFLHEAVGNCGKNGFVFSVIPIVYADDPKDFMPGSLINQRSGPFLRPECVASVEEWFRKVVGKVSDWIDCDSPDSSLRLKSESALTQELRFSSHLSIIAVIVCLKSRRCANLARTLNDYTFQGPNQMIWIKVPLNGDDCDDDVGYDDDVSLSPIFRDGSNNTTCLSIPLPKMDKANASFTASSQARKSLPGHLNGDPKSFDSVTNKDKTVPMAPSNDSNNCSWEWFKVLHTLCDRCERIGVCLLLSSQLPSTAVLLRWLSEPIKCAIVPTSVFFYNPSGFPVLPRSHQDFVRKLIKLDCQFLIEGPNLSRHPERSYVLYLQHIANSLGKPNHVEKWYMGFQDKLQYPLQPLRDNLESLTYEQFEKDPAKYLLYEDAIRAALVDKAKGNKVLEMTVMVVGAGRGPLVQAALNASRETGVPVRVFAVEKNPGCVLRLVHIGDFDSQWRKTVVVVGRDMRAWNAPVKADILVSELLGSFGDNELSPECLDGCNSYLKPDAISIPSSYTSFVAPVQSAKLHNNVRSYREEGQAFDAGYETPYVANLHNCHRLTETQPLFTFRHPNWAATKSASASNVTPSSGGSSSTASSSPSPPSEANQRFGCLTFRIPADATLHGFGGYFHATLYGKYYMSILPDDHTDGMFSWFPFYFPIRDPMQLKAGDDLTVCFWRRVNPMKVWYEWALFEPKPSIIHNAMGKVSSIGL